MPDLRLGFALEGNSDYPVIPRLSRRLIRECYPEIRLGDDAVLRPRKRGHGFVKEMPSFVKQLGVDGIDIVVAVVDTDRTLINERLQLLREAKERCMEMGVAVCIAEGLAVRALEAWLLADERAIFSVFDGERASVSFHAPEEDPDPKNTLNAIVRKLTAGREVSFATYVGDLADAIELKRLRRKCQHFRGFESNLISCVRQWQRLGV